MIIQSFELEPLKYLSTKTSLPLSYLMRANPEEGWTDEYITNLASYVQGLNNIDTFDSFLCFIHI
jgi:hypothetical protein